MAINYASKYAQKIDEKFARESMTSAAVNNDYDFVGVKTVNVYSVPTAVMNDYSVSGTSRYGTPQEIENTVQEMTMTRDRSFTFTIDRGTYNDTQMSNAAGAALQDKSEKWLCLKSTSTVLEKFAKGQKLPLQVR